MSITLRPYQQEAVKATWEYLREHEDNPCIVLPTGTGKAVVLAQLAKDAVKQWGGRVLILAHVKELIEQNSSKVQLLCPEIKIGIYSAGLKSKQVDGDVIVAGIQSVYKKACDLGKFDIIIVDEAHMIPEGEEGEGMYRTFLATEKVINPYIRVIGLTATPFRLKGGIICKPENILNSICYEAGLKEMINNGYLSPIVSKSGSNIANFDHLHVRNGEFIPEEVDVAMNNTRLVQSACKEIAELTKDRKAVMIFACSISHAKKIKTEIELLTGEECALVTGDTSVQERAEIVKRIKGEPCKTDLFGEEKKPLKYLVNVAVFTTGFDAPNIDCIAMLRPTASPGLLLQIAGRGLRLSPNKKDCLFLDYGENIIRHGALDAIRVDETKIRGHKDGEKPAKKCPQCNALIETARSVCPLCGYVFPPRELKHDAYASNVGVITGQATTEIFDVTNVTYNEWHKRNAPEAPPTVCVEYQTGLNVFHREWLCPEHTGYARQKFVKWWEAHRLVPFDEVPNTARETVELADNGALKTPIKIAVKQIAGDKFPRIIGYEYNTEPTQVVIPDEEEMERLPDEVLMRQAEDFDNELVEEVPF